MERKRYFLQSQFLLRRFYSCATCCGKKLGSATPRTCLCLCLCVSVHLRSQLLLRRQLHCQSQSWFWLPWGNCIVQSLSNLKELCDMMLTGVLESEAPFKQTGPGPWYIRIWLDHFSISRPESWKRQFCCTSLHSCPGQLNRWPCHWLSESDFWFQSSKELW